MIAEEVRQQMETFRDQLVEVLKVYDAEAEQAKKDYGQPYSSSASYGTWRLLTGKVLGLARAVEEIDKFLKEVPDGGVQRAPEA